MINLLTWVLFFRFSLIIGADFVANLPKTSCTFLIESGTSVEKIFVVAEIGQHDIDGGIDDAALLYFLGQVRFLLYQIPASRPIFDYEIIKLY